VHLLWRAGLAQDISWTEGMVVRWHVWTLAAIVSASWSWGIAGAQPEEALALSDDAAAWLATLESDSPEKHVDFITRFPESGYASCAAQRMLWLLRQEVEAAGPEFSVPRKNALRSYRKSFLPLLVQRIDDFPPFDCRRPVDQVNPYEVVPQIDTRWWLYGLPEPERKRLFDELLEGYLAQLRHAQDEEILCDACRVLGELGDPAALEPLTLLLEGTRNTSSAAMRAISQLDDPRVPAILLPRLPNASSYVTIEVAGTLRHPDCIPAICELAKSGDDWTQERACDTLGLIGDVRGLPTLLALAGDEREDDLTRASAIEALGRIGDRRAVSLLAASMKAKHLYGDCIVALGRIRSTESVRILVENIVRETGILASLPSQALAACDHPDSAPSLLAALYKKPVGHLSFTMADEERDPVFDGAEEEYRRFSCGTCAMLVWSFQSIDRLLAALEDEGESVRGSAAYAIALAPVRDPRTVSVLVPLLQDEALAASAAFALGSFGDVRAVEPLIDALNHNNVIVRRFAAHALGELGDPIAISPLLKLLDDEDAGLVAVQALGTMKARQASPYLAAMLKKMRWQAPRADGRPEVPSEGKEKGPTLPETMSMVIPPRKPDAERVSPHMRLTTRRDLLTAIRRIGNPDVVPAVREIAEDNSDPLQRDAKRTLAELTGATTDVDHRQQTQTESASKVRMEDATDPQLATLEGARILSNLTANMELPNDADEAVRYMILAGTRFDLIALWPRTKQILFEDLHSQSRDRQLYAARSLIRIGYGDETISELVAALEGSDDERMAHDFVNSGSEQLRQAAITWSVRTGGSLDSQRPAELRWGAMKER